MGFNYVDDGALYDVVCEESREDIAFYVGEALRAQGPCLELGCGTGRVLIPTAEAGVRVTGVDVSASMLALARSKVAALPPEVRERITLSEGDMRSVSLDRRFALVTIPFRSFLHLLTVEDQLATLANIRRHLLPGGRLVLDFFEPMLLIRSLVDADLNTRGLLRQVRTLSPSAGHGSTLAVWTCLTGDYLSQRFTRCMVYDELNSAGEVSRRVYRKIEGRFILPSEFEHLLSRSGFQAEALYGTFERGPVRPGGNLIWIARA